MDHRHLLLEDENEEEELQQSTFMIIIAAAVSLNQRCNVIHRKRIDWHLHVEKLVMEGTFLRSYRMNQDAFNNLVNMVRNDITTNQQY